MQSRLVDQLQTTSSSNAPFDENFPMDITFGTEESSDLENDAKLPVKVFPSRCIYFHINPLLLQKKTQIQEAIEMWKRSPADVLVCDNDISEEFFDSRKRQQFKSVKFALIGKRLYIVQVPTGPHGPAVANMIAQIDRYCGASNLFSLEAESVMKWGNHTHEPDCSLAPLHLAPQEPQAAPNKAFPRVIIEIENQHRSPADLVLIGRRYLNADPNVRAFVGIKFFNRQQNGTFQAIAISLNNNGAHRQVISFGSDNIDNRTTAALVPFDIPANAWVEMGTTVQDLGVGANVGQRPPTWNGGGYITIPLGDVWWNAYDPVLAGIAQPPIDIGDLRLDLWELLLKCHRFIT
jgi:hypothetical protein